MFRALNRPDILMTALAAAGIMMISMGIRQSQGLFVAPLNDTTGLGIATISFALAIGQFTWGHPAPGRRGCRPPWAAHRAHRRHPVAGRWLCLTPYMGTGFGLAVSLGLFCAMGSGASSFSVLLGAAAQRMPAEARGAASG
jgi:hypothetical protein